PFALKPLDSLEVPLPAVFLLGSKTVRVQEKESEARQLQTLAEVTLPPAADAPSRLSSLKLSASAGLQVEDFIRWLPSPRGAPQGAAPSHDFFARAAQAVVDLVGLDSGGVVLRRKSDWQIRAYHGLSRSDGSWETGWRPSQSILQKVIQEKRTFWEAPA